MMMKRCLPIIAFFSCLNFPLFSQTDLPFSRGVNLTNWFQANSAREIHFKKFTRADFEKIQSLGCDVIRLPINLHAMTSGAPDYVPDPLFLTFLDQAVAWAEELGIHLIIDNHTFDPAANTPTDIGPVLVKVWTHLARHYKDRSNLLYYEILNEPHGIDDAVWAEIQQTVIDAIRAEDTEHTIVAGPANWNSFHNLDELPLYNDDNIIYTFHFYDPFVFTHQGATWTDPSMAALAGVPFPYNATAMPSTPPSLTNTWVASALGNYHNEGTLNSVRSLIDIASNFSAARNVPVFCGEFGVFIPNSANADRVRWYENVRKHLEAKGIAWTMWDYTGGFGLFEKGSNEFFESDLNVPLLESLGFAVPPQVPYVHTAETKGFSIYDDYIGERIADGSYNVTGTRDMYHADNPNNGAFCIYWTGTPQYGNVGFDFQPDRDLSLLREHDHVLRFMVRTNSPSARVDIRFIDSKANESDHPWRMGKTVEGVFAADGSWKLVEIPLKEMAELGSWDNAWFPPEGKFDWKAVDRFEIVAEHHAMDGIEFWFDDIEVAGEDVPVEEVPVTGIQRPEMELMTVVPNPALDEVTIGFQAAAGPTHVSIYSLAGTPVRADEVFDIAPGYHRLRRNVSSLAPGVYIVRIVSGKKGYATKLIKR